MSQIRIEIQPVNYSVSAVTISNVIVSLDQTAQIGGFVIGDVVSVPYQVNLSQEEYAAWGTDDNYINDLVITKLGYTKV